MGGNGGIFEKWFYFKCNLKNKNSKQTKDENVVFDHWIYLSFSRHSR